MQCARAFGACVLMRDDPSDKPIPEKFEPSSYHKDQIKNAKMRLEQLNGMNEKEAEEKAQKEWEASLAAYEEIMNAKKHQKDSYEKMLAKVQDWTPPGDDHREFKEFMISQIKESIRFDCGYEPTKPQPKAQDANDWKEAQLKQAQKDIDYHTKAYSEEVERTDGRNKWIGDLRNSLG